MYINIHTYVYATSINAILTFDVHIHNCVLEWQIFLEREIAQQTNQKSKY